MISSIETGDVVLEMDVKFFALDDGDESDE